MGQSGLWMEEPQEASPGEGGPDCSPRLGCGRRRAVRAGCRAAVREEEGREVRTDSEAEPRGGTGMAEGPNVPLSPTEASQAACFTALSACD